MKRLLTPGISILFGILLFLSELLLMGAISLPDQAEHATLRIYKKGYTRPGFGIKINDQMVVKSLKNRSWLHIEVPVGTLTLETVPEVRYPTNAGKSFSLEIEAGKLYYLEAVIDYEFWTSTMYLVLREKERAEAEMKRFKQERNALQKVE